MDNVKVKGSKKSVESIMANQHFGGVLIKKDGIEMYVPETWIYSDGRLKKYAIKAWKKYQKHIHKQNQKKVV